MANSGNLKSGLQSETFSHIWPIPLATNAGSMNLNDPAMHCHLVQGYTTRGHSKENKHIWNENVVG